LLLVAVAVVRQSVVVTAVALVAVLVVYDAQ
jgi:hypothetical protein